MVQVLGKPVVNPLDQLVLDGAVRALQVVLWQRRMDNPELNLVIKPEDIKGLDDCTDYLKIKAGLRIFRPGGLPAMPATPAMGHRPANAGREATPYKDYVVVQMVEAGTENAFRPIENNETDFDKSERANQIRALREQIPVMANNIKGGIARGTFSESEIIEMCDAAVRLARA